MKLPYVFTLFAAALTAIIASGADSGVRPNIIFILIDDLRWDEVDYPFVKIANIQRIAREGVRFRNAFVTTPLCSPSRRLISLANTRTNTASPTTRTTAARATNCQLSCAVARSRLRNRVLGKWHMGVDDNPRPGIDHWVSVRGQGS